MGAMKLEVKKMEMMNLGQMGHYLGERDGVCRYGGMIEGILGGREADISFIISNDANGNQY